MQHSKHTTCGASNLIRPLFSRWFQVKGCMKTNTPFSFYMLRVWNESQKYPWSSILIFVLINEDFSLKNICIKKMSILEIFIVEVKWSLRWNVTFLSKRSPFEILRHSDIFYFSTTTSLRCWTFVLPPTRDINASSTVS